MKKRRIIALALTLSLLVTSCNLSKNTGKDIEEDEEDDVRTESLAAKPEYSPVFRIDKSIEDLVYVINPYKNDSSSINNNMDEINYMDADLNPDYQFVCRYDFYYINEETYMFDAIITVYEYDIDVVKSGTFKVGDMLDVKQSDGTTDSFYISAINGQYVMQVMDTTDEGTNGAINYDAPFSGTEAARIYEAFMAQS